MSKQDKKIRLKGKSDSKGNFAKKNNQIEINRTIDSLHIKYGFKTIEDIEKHIKLEDQTGKTFGCGCWICILRNRIYNSRNLKQHLRTQIGKNYSLIATIEHHKKIPINVYDKIVLENRDFKSPYNKLYNPKGKNHKNKVQEILDLVVDRLFNREEAKEYEKVLFAISNKTKKLLDLYNKHNIKIKEYKKTLHKLRLLLKL